MKTSLPFGVLIVLIAAFGAPGLAQTPPPEATTWSIDQPTLVGETVLQPGTYRISEVTSPKGRNVLRVTSLDGETLFATVLTVPHEPDPGEEMPNNTFVYFPGEPGQTRILRTWFPADAPMGIGHDIVFDEDRAREIARLADRRIVYYPSTVEVAEIDEDADLRVITPEEEVEVWTPRTTTTTTITELDTDAERAIVLGAREELPATAGRMPLVALLGFVALGAAAAIRFAVR